jgi:dihydroorotase
MAETYDVVFRGGTVVTPDGAAVRDVGVRGHRIAAIGAIAPAQGGKVVDCVGLHILPGVIDTQVHFREPGGMHKEDLETGSRAAVLGGVTAVFEMPNTDPPTISEKALADKLSRAKGRMHCDHAFFIGGTADNIDDLPQLERLPGCAGVKIFVGSSTGTLLVDDESALRRIFQVIRRRCALHCEDETRLGERRDLRVPNDPSSHPVWRDAEAALISTKRVVRLAHETGARVHILHVSTAGEMRFLVDHKDVATVEATPHHLTLAAEEAYPRLGTFAQMNPPIRARVHVEGVWWGVRQGIVDVLGSDHAPHTREEKAQPYPASPSGMPGVQTLVPVALTEVARGRLTLARFIDLTSAGPARVFGIAGKGRIAVGYDADFTVVDLKRREIIHNRWIASRAGWTPYHGHEAQGWPIGTVIRGNVVAWDGEIVTRRSGAPVRFLETLGTHAMAAAEVA